MMQNNHARTASSWADDPALSPWRVRTGSTTPPAGTNPACPQLDDDPALQPPGPEPSVPAPAATPYRPAAERPGRVARPEAWPRSETTSWREDTGPRAAPSAGMVEEAWSTVVGPRPDDSFPARPAPGPGFPVGSADALSQRLFASSHHARPRQGLRGAIYAASRGRLNPGLSAAEADRLSKPARVRAPLAGWHTITVASMKGGIGKTTVSSLLGLTLAEYRGDRVIALDANPDAGTLAERLLGQPVQCTIRDLISREDLHRFRSLADISTYLNVAGRLQVLASEQDPAMSEAFSRDEYRKVLAVLSRFFSIVITDSGTGLIHSAMAGALEATRSLVIVGAPTIDGGSRASKTLDWLIAHGFDELVRDAVVVLSCDRESRSIDRSMVIEHFAARCRAVVEIPRDPHLAEGGLIQLDQLRERTRDAALGLAAHIADAFSWDYPVPIGFAGERG